MAKTVKQKRLEGIIRRDVTEIIAFQVKDPDVSNVTVTDVRVSNDHSYATIYVTFYGNKSHRDARKQRAISAPNSLSAWTSADVRSSGSRLTGPKRTAGTSMS